MNHALHVSCIRRKCYTPQEGHQSLRKILRSVMCHHNDGGNKLRRRPKIQARRRPLRLATCVDLPDEGNVTILGA
jgi:hypothetical protein